ncbi:quinone-dependent dihydroorotate dehydrogenase [Acidithiobacillus ferrivorans]|uniref:Dihydroorotate dehydrogenase (quinone) n=1 Tax=Acidithiobacillus ferrivorans TaxID=160808 RepID=A0A7T5BH57_9PROT|nr:quinone-dependent dihydroorotate dehydrogenase [Acidithiobacillus ferrivorans]MBN6741528.1 quinone-dependent dihydroorotate dehydrogenase [Acidithiobacillus sp. MC6.1]QQD71883.1 quinone-dependent dihydroorotate dehydrogenase [Acidithiobacillus ferrivorans]
MSYRLLRPLLFTLDPERAHTLSIAALAALGRMPQSMAYLTKHYSVTDPRLAQDFWGLHFPNPVGLAAGYDKDAHAAAALPALGFGFIEIGTVTPRPQPGNPRPRVFRYPAQQTVINRMGFPGEGAAAVAHRLAALSGHPVPIGINLGKNRDTPLAQAQDDYIAALELLFHYGDYLCINVSSPNTPGLRLLQGEEALRGLLCAVAAANQRLAVQYQRAPLPLLLKIAPDLDNADLNAIGGLALGAEPLVDGFIATNTTIKRPTSQPGLSESGGLSGAPLLEQSNAVIAQLYRATQGQVPIIGVGGILSAADAYAKIQAGASLLQVYSGLIFRGPELVREILETLPELWLKDGYPDLAHARGSAA